MQTPTHPSSFVLDAGEAEAFAGIPTGNHWQRSRHVAAFSRFLADVEADFEARAVRFLREEIGLKAPVSNMSSWMQPPEYQGVLAGPTPTSSRATTSRSTARPDGSRSPRRAPAPSSPKAERTKPGR